MMNFEKITTLTSQIEKLVEENYHKPQWQTLIRRYDNALQKLQSQMAQEYHSLQKEKESLNNSPSKKRRLRKKIKRLVDTYQTLFSK